MTAKRHAPCRANESAAFAFALARIPLAVLVAAGCSGKVTAPDSLVAPVVDAGSDATEGAPPPTVSVTPGAALCSAGAVRACHAGPVALEGVGACRAGTQRCADDGGRWLECEGAVGPTLEQCSTPEDDDCDGTANEPDECSCTPGATRACYGGPLSTRSVGACHDGIATCDPTGTWGACEGETVPSVESCAADQFIDEDCDGKVNEENCTCVPGTSTSCSGTPFIGICSPGWKECKADGTGYGACINQVLPQTEICGNGLDDDCDGLLDPDEGCGCHWNDTQPCYDGPDGTRGVGACRDGWHYCQSTATFSAACSGETTPRRENCAAIGDEDCSGSDAPTCSSTVLNVPFQSTAVEGVDQVVSLSSGTFILAGRTFTDPLGSWIREIDATGATLWQTARGNGSTAVVARADDDSLVIAQAEPAPGPVVTFGTRITRLDTTRQVVWSQFLPITNVFTPRDIAVDAAGDVLVSGVTNYDANGGGSVTNATHFIARFSSSGQQQYWRLFESTDAVFATNWHSDGTAFVALERPAMVAPDGGFVAGGLHVLAVAPDGATRFDRTFDSHGNASANVFPAPSQLVVDGSNVWVAGPYVGNFSGQGVALPLVSKSAFVLHLDPDGGSIWARDIPALDFRGLQAGGGVVSLQGTLGLNYLTDVGFGPMPSGANVLLRMDGTGSIYGARLLGNAVVYAFQNDAQGRLLTWTRFNSASPPDFGAGPLPSSSAQYSDVISVFTP